jgi:hypothetical protein
MPVDRTKKGSRLEFRVNEIEKALFEKNAEEFGLSKTDYFKYCCLINPPKNPIRKEEKEK